MKKYIKLTRLAIKVISAFWAAGVAGLNNVKNDLGASTVNICASVAKSNLAFLKSMHVAKVPIKSILSSRNVLIKGVSPVARFIFSNKASARADIYIHRY